MGQAKDLIALGLPAELAKRVGFDVLAKTTTAATQGSAGGLLTGPGNKLIIPTITSGGDAFTLPAAADIGDIIIIPTTANNCIIFPATGGTINNGTANQKLAVAANLVALLIKATATNWKAFVSGVATVS